MLKDPIVIAALKNGCIVPEQLAAKVNFKFSDNFEFVKSRFGETIIVPVQFQKELVEMAAAASYNHYVSVYGLPDDIAHAIAYSDLVERAFIARGVAKAINSGLQIKIISLYNKADAGGSESIAHWAMRFGIRVKPWFISLRAYEKHFVSNLMVDVAKREGI